MLCNVVEEADEEGFRSKKMLFSRGRRDCLDPGNLTSYRSEKQTQIK